MKKKWLAVLITVLVAGLMVFTSCGDDSSGGGGGGIISVPIKTATKDGIYTTEAPGAHMYTPIKVETTIVNTNIIRIKILSHGETADIFAPVESLLPGRIIQYQSLGVDNIAGASVSSRGIKRAVERAIEEAGGVPDEWYDTPKKVGGITVLPWDGGDIYDVIVVGLGGTGVTAYSRASEDTTNTVIGIEWSGKIGGNSATVSGPATLEATATQDAVRAYMMGASGAEVNKPPYEEASPQGAQHHRGGAKTEVLDKFITEAGNTYSWITASPYSVTFGGLSAGFSGSLTNIWRSYSGDKWTHFNRMLTTAKARNPRNEYLLEMRGEKLIMDNTDPNNPRVTGVEATHIPTGTTYRIYGRTVILATGGFIANPQMTTQWFGSPHRYEAVGTHQGYGIRMGLEVGAGTYNIEMPGATHISHLRNVPLDPIIHPVTGVNLTTVASGTQTLDRAWKATLRGLATWGASMIVGQYDTRWSNLYNADGDKPGVGAGKRFFGEGIGSPYASSLDFGNWKGGGHWAAIYSDDLWEYVKTGNTVPNPRGAGTVTLSNLPGGSFMSQGTALALSSGIAEIENILEAGRQQGNVIKANSLADLASQLDVPVATLRATIERYNGFVEDGIDSDFSKTAANLALKIELGAENTTPVNYTAVLGSGYYYGTCGGLDVDDDMHVLYANSSVGNQNPIPGLYAGGQDTMGVLHTWTKEYSLVGGIAQGWAITSGRLAGAAATAEATLLKN